MSRYALKEVETYATKSLREYWYVFLVVVVFASMWGWAISFMWQNNENTRNERTWCAEQCGSQRVLVCTHVYDDSWPKPRRAVGCLRDPEGKEVRFVIEQPEKSP